MRRIQDTLDLIDNKVIFSKGYPYSGFVFVNGVYNGLYTGLKKSIVCHK